MHVQYAKTEVHRCPMAEQVCAETVARHVAELKNLDVETATSEIETACGRYSRGAHKGQLRGWAVVTVVREGGWNRAVGGVLYPGTVVSVTISDFNNRPYYSAK